MAGVSCRDSSLPFPTTTSATPKALAARLPRVAALEAADQAVGQGGGGGGGRVAVYFTSTSFSNESGLSVTGGVAGSGFGPVGEDGQGGTTVYGNLTSTHRVVTGSAQGGVIFFGVLALREERRLGCSWSFSREEAPPKSPRSSSGPSMPFAKPVAYAERNRGATSSA